MTPEAKKEAKAAAEATAAKEKEEKAAAEAQEKAEKDAAMTEEEQAERLRLVRERLQATMNAEQQAVEAVALAAATRQLKDVAGAAVVGMPQLEFNDVYLPAGDHEGWPRFESPQGKHLYFLLEFSTWVLRDTFDPNAAGAPAYTLATDGLLPTAEHGWTYAGDDCTL